MPIRSGATKIFLDWQDFLLADSRFQFAEGLRWHSFYSFESIFEGTYACLAPFTSGRTVQLFYFQVDDDIAIPIISIHFDTHGVAGIGAIDPYEEVVLMRKRGPRRFPPEGQSHRDNIPRKNRITKTMCTLGSTLNWVGDTEQIDTQKQSPHLGRTHTGTYTAHKSIHNDTGRSSTQPIHQTKYHGLVQIQLQ